MGSFPSWFRAAPLVRPRASIFAVGRRVYVACAGGGPAHVALTDDAGADARTRLTDGTEVEILAWRPRKFDGTRYRVRVTGEGFEGWLAGDNLRSTPSCHLGTHGASGGHRVRAARDGPRGCRASVRPARRLMTVGSGNGTARSRPHDERADRTHAGRQ